MRKSWPLVLLLFGCAASSGQLHTSKGTLDLVGFEVEERSILEATLMALEGASAEPFDPGLWADGTAFARVYGFEFSGPALLKWWLARIDRLDVGDPWTVAVHDGQNRITLRPDFFELPLVDRLSVLVHEARHADGQGHPHVVCPAALGLGDSLACDGLPLGAYTFQAAFMFELHARRLLDAERAERGFKEARRRVLAAYPAARPSR